MKEQSPEKQRVLGWIAPDDNIRPDRDCYQVDSWLARRGMRGIRTVVRTAPSTGVHAREDLLETGNLTNLLQVARALAGEGCESVAWACTSGSFVGGYEWAHQQVKALAKTAGCPATNTSLAIVAAIRQLGHSVVDVLSPYPSNVTWMFERFLGDAGIRVSHSRSLNAPTGRTTYELDLRGEVDHFVASLRGTAYPVVIPDNAANSLHLLENLEASLRRPVVTANQAVLWHALLSMGLTMDIAGGGELFKGLVKRCSLQDDERG